MVNCFPLHATSGTFSAFDHTYLTPLVMSAGRHLVPAVISWFWIPFICSSGVQRIEVQVGRYHSCSRNNSDAVLLPGYFGIMGSESGKYLRAYGCMIIR